MDNHVSQSPSAALGQIVLRAPLRPGWSDFVARNNPFVTHTTRRRGSAEDRRRGLANDWPIPNEDRAFQCVTRRDGQQTAKFSILSHLSHSNLPCFRHNSQPLQSLRSFPFSLCATVAFRGPTLPWVPRAEWSDPGLLPGNWKRTTSSRLPFSALSATPHRTYPSKKPSLPIY